jgi:ABC-type multidrug transport system fused ATPase/permease subunit
MPSPFPPELRWLFPKVRPQLPLHIASFLCLTLASLLALVTPLSIRWLIDTILPSHDSHLLLAAIGLIFASYEARAVLNALGGYLTFRATQHTALALRMSLLRHLDSLSADYFDRTPVGELLYPFEGPIDEISYFGSDLLPSILRTAVAAGVTLSAMAVLSPLLVLVVIPLVPAFLVLRHRYRRRIGQQADLVQIARSKFSSFLQEHLSALTQIQLLRQTDSQERRASQLLASTVCSQDSLCKTGAFFSALSNLTIATGITVVLSCGSVLVFGNKLTIGTLVAFYSLLIQLFDPLSAAMEMYSRAQRTFSSIRQIQTVLEIGSAVREHCRAKPLAPHVPLHVAFRNVSFGYQRKSILIRIPRLEILQGERVAIVGPNGAGKSTLGKLLARVYDVESGEIFIAGSDARLVTLESLRSSVCYLPAQPILFHRSLADNLRIGRFESTPGDLERVLRMVGLTRYLDGCPGSLEEPIEPSASNLSNGERQRVAIARALLHRPRILILDETTSSLDPASEEAILRTIDRTLPDSTLIVVSHRVHSISWMGRILLMRKGQIVGDGNHSVLSATNPLYTQLLTSRVAVG